MRRFGLQIAGVCAALAVVVGLWMTGSHSGGAVRPRPAALAARATPAPTPDGRVAAVKAAVRAFIAAYAESGWTGNASVLDPLTVPDSQAQGNAGDLAAFVHIEHRAFVPVRIDVADTSWRIAVVGEFATCTVSFAVYGHHATWPALRRTGPDVLGPVNTLQLDLDASTGPWLVNRLS